MKSTMPVLMKVNCSSVSFLLVKAILSDNERDTEGSYQPSAVRMWGGLVPPFDSNPPAENIRVISKNLEAKLKQAKLKSKATNIETILSYHEARKEVLKTNKAVPLSKNEIKAINRQYLQEVSNQNKEVIGKCSNNPYKISKAAEKAHKIKGSFATGFFEADSCVTLRDGRVQPRRFVVECGNINVNPKAVGFAAANKNRGVADGIRCMTKRYC